MFDKVLDAVKQLGVPIVISGVLLWFMLTEVHHMIQESRQTQLAMQAAIMQIQTNQTAFKDDIRAWIAHGCPGAIAPASPPIP